jgi:hypothetical protein
VTRNLFGGTTSDNVWTAASVRAANGNSVSVEMPSAATVLFYDAQTAGNQITDLQDLTNAPISQVAVDASGDVPMFYGPDGVTQMWASANGGPRRLIVSLQAAANAVSGAQTSATDASASASAAASSATDAANSASTAQAAASTATAPTDSMVAGLVPTSSGSATSSALAAALVAQPGALSLSGTGFASRRDKYGDFQVRGWNLGKIGSATTTAFWTTNYNLTTIQAALDNMARFGANTVRITGSYTAYSQDAATHKSRTHAVWDYAKSLGLKIIYAWMNNNHDTLSSANGSAYNAMVDDMIVGYTNDPGIFAWEIANEMPIANYPDWNTLATNFAAHLRSADPGKPITGGGNGGQDIADVSAYDPIVDFHDIHLYAGMTDLAIFTRSPLEQSLAAATKPVLIGEMGANTATTGSSRMGDEAQATQFYRAMRRWIDGTTMGALVWNMFDDGDGTNFGMFASDNVTPRARLAPVLRYPDRSTQSARDFVAFREHPILIDNFSRPDSGTNVGGPLIGKNAAAAQQGTWGISGKALYVATPAAGGSNFITWDCGTADVDFEAELFVGSTVHVGVVLRYIDGGNFTILEYNSNNGGINFNHKVGGANAYTSSVYPMSAYGSIRLRMAVAGQAVTMFIHDKPVFWSQQINFSATELTTTKHGLFLKSAAPNADAGSTFKRIKASVPGRTF